MVAGLHLPRALPPTAATEHAILLVFGEPPEEPLHDLSLADLATGAPGARKTPVQRESHARATTPGASLSAHGAAASRVAGSRARAQRQHGHSVALRRPARSHSGPLGEEEGDDRPHKRRHAHTQGVCGCRVIVRVGWCARGKVAGGALQTRHADGVCVLLLLLLPFQAPLKRDAC